MPITHKRLYAGLIGPIHNIYRIESYIHIVGEWLLMMMIIIIIKLFNQWPSNGSYYMNGGAVWGDGETGTERLRDGELQSNYLKLKQKPHSLFPFTRPYVHQPRTRRYISGSAMEWLFITKWGSV